VITLTLVCANVSLVAILLVLAFWLIQRSSNRLFDLGALFAFQLALNYPVRILLLVFFQEDAVPSYRDLLDPEALLRTTAVSALGVCAFSVSYLWLSRSRFGSRPPPVPRFEDGDFAALAVIYAISLAAKAVKVATGNYISYLIGAGLDMRWANLLENVHMLGWFVLAAVWLAFFGGQVKHPGRIVLFWVVSIVEIAYQIIQGSKTFLMLPLFVVGLAYYTARRRVPYLLIAGAISWFCFVVFPFVGAFRTVVNQDLGEIPGFEEFQASETVRNAAEGLDDSRSGALEVALKASGRFAGADELHNFMVEVPDTLPYRFGRDFLVVLLTPIPRAIWPSKPVYSLGAEYGTQLNTITSVTPFPIGEAYWNGGLIGVVLGMALWAGFLAALMHAFGKLIVNPRWAALFSGIFVAEAYWLTTPEASLPMAIASTLKRALVYAAVLWSAHTAIHGAAGRRPLRPRAALNATAPSVRRPVKAR
jgi:hypothetical protein